MFFAAWPMRILRASSAKQTSRDQRVQGVLHGPLPADGTGKGLFLRIQEETADFLVCSLVVAFEGENVVRIGIADLAGDLLLGAHGVDGDDALQEFQCAQQLPCPKHGGEVGMWLRWLPLVLVFGCALFTVGGYTITPDAILVQRLLWATRLPRAGLKSAEFVPKAMCRSLRTCGNGGFFHSPAFTGAKRSNRIGPMSLI